jgi:Leucine-rich repeat (LRR) protein
LLEQDENDENTRKWMSRLPSLRNIQLRFNDMRHWPSFLDSSSSLQSLDLGFNELTLAELSPSTEVSSPSTFTNMLSNIFRRKSSSAIQTTSQHRQDKIMPSLTILDLSNNHITTFPINLIRKLPSLMELKLNGNELTKTTTNDIGNEMCRLIRLELMDCKLTSIPIYVLQNMPQLQVLLLDRNPLLRELDTVCEKLHNLVELQISDTGVDLNQIHHIMQQLPTLRKLCANKNKIRGIFKICFSRSSQLRVLELNKNKITRVTIELDDQSTFKLSALDLSSNRIEHIDEQISQFCELTTLNLSDNNLDKCPPTQSMRYLVELRLDHNRIQHLQESCKLRVLTASHNQLQQISDRIALLSELEHLDLSHNRIRDYALPSSATLTCLERLNLEYNYLSCIVQHDENISGLVALQELRIGHNELTKLPNGITMLQNLKTFTCDQNSQSLTNAVSTSDEFLEWKNRYHVNVTCEFELPVQVTESLFLGSMHAASNRSILSSLGISHVLTVANDAKARHLDDESNDLTCLHLQLRENKDANLRLVLDQAFSFIDQGRQQGSCLVHCVAGINRSASIVIAYLMFSEKLSYEQAYEKVKSVRQEINPMRTFVQQLIAYDKEMNNVL